VRRGYKGTCRYTCDRLPQYIIFGSGFIAGYPQLNHKLSAAFWRLARQYGNASSYGFIGPVSRSCNDNRVWFAVFTLTSTVMKIGFAKGMMDFFMSTSIYTNLTSPDSYDCVSSFVRVIPNLLPPTVTQLNRPVESSKPRRSHTWLGQTDPLPYTSRNLVLTMANT
jgi:hypothetical protein